MKYFNLHSILLSLVILILAGCQKQGPVELVNEANESPNLELESTIIQNGDAFEADSAGLLPQPGQRYFGQLVIAGAEFDGPFEHQEASLASATFLDRNSPILVNDEATGFYRTIDAGIIRIDGIILFKLDKVVTRPRSTIRDTVGVYYALYSLNGVGGRGFRYIPNQTYRWQGSGYAPFPSYDISIMTPPRIRVLSPTPRDVVYVTRNLPIRWDGGGRVVRITISSHRPGARPRPILQMRVLVNRGSVVIPPSILRLLPNDVDRFVFTVWTENSTITQITGFQDTVLVQAISSHSVLLQINR